MIAQYPHFSEISPEDRAVLHPYFLKVDSGISEFTFANIYLFRNIHNYRISKIKDGLFVLSGNDNGKPFFALPFGMADYKTLER